MYENVITYKTEYKTDERGNRLRFAVDSEGTYRRDKNGNLIPDPNGRYYRQWRDEIRTEDDIWQEIVRRAGGCRWRSSARAARPSRSNAWPRRSPGSSAPRRDSVSTSCA